MTIVLARDLAQYGIRSMTIAPGQCHHGNCGIHGNHGNCGIHGNYGNCDNCGNCPVTNGYRGTHGNHGYCPN